MKTLIAILALCFIGAVIWSWYLGVCIEFHKQRAANLQRWLRKQLLEVRLECAHVSPQVITLIDALEGAETTLAPINIVALRRELARIARERDAYVTEEAQHWCKVRAAAEQAARQGAELPGLGGAA